MFLTCCLCSGLEGTTLARDVLREMTAAKEDVSRPDNVTFRLMLTIANNVVDDDDGVMLRDVIKTFEDLGFDAEKALGDLLVDELEGGQASESNMEVLTLLASDDSPDDDNGDDFH